MESETVLESLTAFAPITLSDMAAVALLDRMDTQYVLTLPQSSALLPALWPSYRVLEIDGRRVQPRTRGRKYTEGLPYRNPADCPTESAVNGTITNDKFGMVQFGPQAR